MANLNLDISGTSSQVPIDMRVNEFKADPDKMNDINDFVNELVEKARVEAEIRRTNAGKSKLDAFGLQNGGKKIGASINKAKTSARTFATRVFTVICNCTNTVKSAVINRN